MWAETAREANAAEVFPSQNDPGRLAAGHKKLNRPADTPIRTKRLGVGDLNHFQSNWIGLARFTRKEA